MVLVFSSLLFGVVFLFLSTPLWRREASLPGAKGLVQDEEIIDLSVEKESLLRALSDLEMDTEASKTPEGERLKLEYEHRLSEIFERLDLLRSVNVAQPTAGDAPLGKRRWIPTATLAGVLIPSLLGASALVHWNLGRSAVSQQSAQPAGGGMPINPVEMVARLEKRLKENPDNLQDQMMAGRSYMTLERWEDAKAAWGKVLLLDERSHAAHYALGEILIRTAMGEKGPYEEALAHFDQALINTPQDPVILWAKGIALLQLERREEADTVWTEAFQYIPPGTDSSEMVGRALQELRAGKPAS